MKQIKDLEEKILDGKKANNEVHKLKILVDTEVSLLIELKDLLELLKQKNIRLIRDDPEPKENTLNFYEKIKLETEEQNEKFIAETNGKNIEIKMEIPTAPEEDEITSSAVFQDVSDSKIPNVFIKTEAPGREQDQGSKAPSASFTKKCKKNN